MLPPTLRHFEVLQYIYFYPTINVYPFTLVGLSKHITGVNNDLGDNKNEGKEKSIYFLATKTQISANFGRDKGQLLEKCALISQYLSLIF